MTEKKPCSWHPRIVWSILCDHTQSYRASYEAYVKTANKKQRHLLEVIESGDDERLFALLKRNKTLLGNLPIDQAASTYRKISSYTPEALRKAADLVLPDLQNDNAVIWFRRYGDILPVPVPPGVKWERFNLFYVRNKVRLVDETFVNRFLFLKTQDKKSPLKRIVNLPKKSASQSKAALPTHDWFDFPATEKCTTRAGSREKWQYIPAMQKLDVVKVTTQLQGDEPRSFHTLVGYDQNISCWEPVLGQVIAHHLDKNIEHKRQGGRELDWGNVLSELEVLKAYKPGDLHSRSELYAKINKLVLNWSKDPQKDLERIVQNARNILNLFER